MADALVDESVAVRVARKALLLVAKWVYFLVDLMAVL